MPIGTTPETVIAAALAVGWDVDEALRIAGMSASESVVRAIETKMFGSKIRAEVDDPDWLLYLEALLEYVDNHGELPTSDVATLILECEFLAREALEAQPPKGHGGYSGWAVWANIDASLDFNGIVHLRIS